MVDLVVHGAGVLGLTVAWEAAKRGLKVCISDPNGIAGMASGGIVGALAPHVTENWNSKKQLQFQSFHHDRVVDKVLETLIFFRNVSAQ